MISKFKYLLTIINIYLLQSDTINLCDEAILDSPIDLGFPWNYLDFTVKTNFNKISSFEIKKITNNNFLLQNDKLGSINYNNNLYNIKELYIKSPSEHKINDLRYSMEIQVIGYDSNMNQLVYVVLFELIEAYSNPDLFSLGLGSFNLKNLTSIDKDEYSSYKFRSPFSLDYFSKNTNSYFLYEGSSTNNNCQKSIYIVNANISWIGFEQLKEFDDMPFSKFKIKNLGNRRIFQNFVSNKNNYYYNDTMVMQYITPIVPAPFEFYNYAFDYISNNLPLGYLKLDIWKPYWLLKNKENVLSISNPIRFGPFKFLELLYEEINEKNNKKILKPLFIMVHNKYNLPEKKEINSVSMYLRSNFTIQDGVRPVYLIDIPIFYESNIKPINNSFDSNFIKICNKWILKVVLNRNFNHEDLDKELKDQIEENKTKNECKNYIFIPRTSDEKYDPVLENNFDNTRNDNDYSNSNAKNYTNCQLYLSVVLNNEHDESLTDYMNTKCANSTEELNDMIRKSHV